MSRNALLAAIICAGRLAAADSPSVTFNKDVLPILQKNCQACHLNYARELSLTPAS